MWTRRFWAQTLERALKTFAQTIIALAGADGLNLVSLGYLRVAQLAGMAALISVLTSLASNPFAHEPDTPSLVKVSDATPTHRA